MSSSNSSNYPLPISQGPLADFLTWHGTALYMQIHGRDLHVQLYPLPISQGPLASNPLSQCRDVILLLSWMHFLQTPHNKHEPLTG
jgi:hypothetical protein